MPKVFSQNGFDFYIYLKDHEPPHVHVFKGGGMAKIVIGTTLTLAQNNLKRQEIKSAKKLTRENEVFLMQKWREING
ncbi:MAG: DUF4160 domain-containing protein [Pyrinomonadaceae bacterium]